MFQRCFLFLLGFASLDAAPLPRIAVSADGKHFVEKGSDRVFVPWGFNYDHDSKGRLIEDYWHDEWPAVVGDFEEMKALGANVVRIHLQLGKVMNTPDQPDPKTLARLARLIDLAGEKGLYLDLTGLGCYHAKDIPAWYDALPEKQRWAVQARFWKAVAETAKGRPEIFCYPERGKIDEALKALAVYEVGKPLVIEEIFPLKCDVGELESFIDRSSSTVDGWVGFYWGTPPDQLDPKEMSGAITRGWLEYFLRHAARMKAGGKPIESPGK